MAYCSEIDIVLAKTLIVVASSRSHKQNGQFDFPIGGGTPCTVLFIAIVLAYAYRSLSGAYFRLAGDKITPGTRIEFLVFPTYITSTYDRA